MPNKGKGKGGKKKRRGKKTTGPNERKLITSDGPEQQYAQAVKPLGDRRFLANCFDSKTKNWSEKIIHIRGKFRKRVWVNPGDMVLISTREFEFNPDADDDKYPFGGDVIHVYQEQEIKKLKKLKEIVLNENETNDNDNGYGVVYISDSEEESEKDEIEIAPQRRRMDMPSSDSEDSEDLDGMVDAL